MPDISQLVGGGYGSQTDDPVAAKGVISQAPATLNDPMYVLIPEESTDYNYGPCEWVPKGTTIPQAGAACLVVFDEEGTPYVPWWEGNARFPSGDPGTGTAIVPDAAGDGVTDDTAVIQEALDTARDSGGGIVQLRAGTFLVTGLVLASNVTLMGSGSDATVIKLKAGSPAGTHVVKTQSFDTLVGTDNPANNGEHGFMVADLTIDGNKTGNPSGGHGLAIFGYAYRLSGVRSLRCHGDGIYSEWVTTSNLPYDTGEQFEANWDDVKAQDCDGTGILFNGPHDSYLSHINAVQNYGHGIHLPSKAIGTLMFIAHSWGTAQVNSIRIEAQGAQLMNTTAESSSDSCLAILAHDVQFQGEVFNGFQPSAERPSGVNKGIELGSASVSVAAVRLDAYIHGCNDGCLIFTNEAGSSDIRANIYGTGGNTVIGFAGAGTRIAVNQNGSGTASYIPDDRNCGEFTVRGMDYGDRLKIDTGGKVVYWPNGTDHRAYFDSYSNPSWRLRGDLGTIETYGQVITHGKTVGPGGTIPAYVSYVAVTGSGARSVTLPAASAQPGIILTIKDEQGNAGSGPITINRTGSDLIDGSASTAISTNYGGVQLYSTGSSWTTWQNPSAATGSGTLDPWHVVGDATTGLGTTFQNGWVNYGGGYPSVAFRKDPFGRVHLRGLVKSGTITSAIFQLPAGYLPAGTSAQLIFSQEANSASADVRVSYAGYVTPNTGSNVWLSLDGISFDTDTVTTYLTGPKGDKGDPGVLMDRGTATASFPGGSARSNTLTVPHNLGVVPKSVICTARVLAHDYIAQTVEGGFTTSSFQVIVRTLDGLLPAAGASESFDWAAYA